MQNQKKGLVQGIQNPNKKGSKNGGRGRGERNNHL